jgi:hypothetical protein
MRSIFSLLLFITLFSCNRGDQIPDVSGVKITLHTERFEMDLFKSDSADFPKQLKQLVTKYPSFGENFIYTILYADETWKEDSIAGYVKRFTKDYRSIYDTSQLNFKDFTPYEKEIKKGFQFIKYYFPAYRLPQKIITFIGPLDGAGIVLADDIIGVGLQSYLGKNFSLYQSEMVQQTYPGYISRNFEPGYIALNCVKNISLDIYPEKLDDKSLVHQMIEKGKRLFMLKKLLPDLEEYKLIGYTEHQLQGCYKNEMAIWDLFIKNNLLQSIDNNLIKNYIGESPKTPELVDDEGNAAPGNIGSFAGWQIVKKYMSKNPSVTLPQLITMDDETIFTGAKYKP